MQNQQRQELDTTTKIELSGKTYKCESCGNFLHYDPDSKKLKCKHCSSIYDIHPTTKAMELTYTSASEQGYEDWSDEIVIKCKSCGALTVLEKYETTINCPFCNAPNITHIDDIKGIKPNAILPFEVSEEKAHEFYKKWIKSKLFAPNDLRKKALKQDMKGIYLPCFTFDCGTDTNYEIRYGKHYFVTVGSGKNARQVRRTRWYTDRGFINKNFDDVQIEASQFITQKELAKIGGFDTQNSVAYHNQFISGYYSERYSKSLDESWEEVKDYANKKIADEIKSRYNADVISYCNLNTSYNDTTYKYTLVPLWFIKYKYENKKYGCMINGRSGKVAGKTPLSKLKVSFATIFAIGVIALILYFVLPYIPI